MMVRFMRAGGPPGDWSPGDGDGRFSGPDFLSLSNIHNLRTGTDLTDMFGNRDPQWQAASKLGKELGYGNQLFVLIEAPESGADTTDAMEEMADRLTAEMQASGQFKQARCGSAGRRTAQHCSVLYLEFPVFRVARSSREFKQRLDPKQIHRTIRRSATELVTPFSTLGADYFVADPLGPDGSGGTESQGSRSSPASTWHGEAATDSSARITRRC